MDGLVQGWQGAARRREVPVRAYLDLTLAMATVGSSAIIGKVMVEHLPVFLASAGRFGLATAVLVPLLLWRSGGVPAVGRRDLGVLFLQALTGVFGFAVFWLFGLRLTTASEGGIVASVTPAVVGLASVALLGERLGRRETAGIACAVAGVGMMAALGGVAGAGNVGDRLLGDGLILGAVLGEALFIVLGKRVGARVEPLTIATAVTAFGFLLFLPGAVYEATSMDFGAVPGRAWAAVVAYALGPTVLGYLLLYRGLARVPASTSAVFAGVVPVTSLLLAWALLGEAVLWTHLVGVAAVLLGIGLTCAGGGGSELPGRPTPRPGRTR
jgi:drug/metabolite transporter (DMT)-like permease